MSDINTISASALSMGGYGIYVWPSYALAAAILLLLLIRARAGLKATSARLAALQDPHEP